MTPVATRAIDPAQTNNLRERPPIILTSSDRDSLLTLLRTAAAGMEPSVARFLSEEVERADVVSAEISPTAVVAIGSTVKFIDHAAVKIRHVKLVLPEEANDVDHISVSEALGSALVGLGPGQTITWHEGQTERQITILATLLPKPNQRRGQDENA